MIYKAANVQEAVVLATDLKQMGKYNWFRGQIQNWPLLSSFARLKTEKSTEALQKAARFEHWFKTTRGLEDIAATPTWELLLHSTTEYQLPLSISQRSLASPVFLRPMVDHRLFIPVASYASIRRILPSFGRNYSITEATLHRSSSTSLFQTFGDLKLSMVYSCSVHFAILRIFTIRIALFSLTPQR